VDLTLCEEPFLTISESLEKEGRKMGMDVRMMKEEIFDAMHRI
jgi:predicted amino acid-binding ACT domain protein